MSGDDRAPERREERWARSDAAFEALDRLESSDEPIDGVERSQLSDPFERYVWRVSQPVLRSHDDDAASLRRAVNAARELQIALSRIGTGPREWIEESIDAAWENGELWDARRDDAPGSVFHFGFKVTLTEFVAACLPRVDDYRAPSRAAKRRRWARTELYRALAHLVERPTKIETAGAVRSLLQALDHELSLNQLDDEYGLRPSRSIAFNPPSPEVLRDDYLK